MIAYRAFGLTVASSVPLPGVPASGGREPECVLRIGSGPLARTALGPLRRLRLPNGRVSLTLGRYGERHLVRFPRLADFLLSGDGREIECVPAPGAEPAVLAHLFLAQVLPLALTRRDRLVFHASAVVTSSGAIAFLGAPGRGKSTLGASFVRDSFPLLADDGLLLAEHDGALTCVPSYPEIRLWPDALATLDGDGGGTAPSPGKRRLALSTCGWPFSREPVPLRRLYVLGALRRTARAVSIAPLSAREAFIEVVKHTYRLDFDDRARLRSEFDTIGRIVSRSIVYRLRVARDLSRLAEVRAAILAHLAA